MLVAVTGGAGFIGSHTVEALIEAGHDVWVVDDLSTGRRENLPARAKLVVMDIARPPGGLRALERLFAELRPEGVVHLAAQSKVAAALAEPDRDSMVNVVGTVNVLEAARRSGVRRVVYASSAAVYGDPAAYGAPAAVFGGLAAGGGDGDAMPPPVTEDAPVRPRSFYGASKYAAELYFPVYAELYGLGYAVLRYANVYGPRQDASLEGGVVAIFTDRLVSGQAPVIHGDGEQTRDFIYVRDVAAANQMALEASVSGVFNISTGTSVSVKGLFGILRRICGAGVEPCYGEPRPGDIRHSCLDNSRAKAALGWEARFGLEQGLMETVAWRRGLGSRS